MPGHAAETPWYPCVPVGGISVRKVMSSRFLSPVTEFMERTLLNSLQRYVDSAAPEYSENLCWFFHQIPMNVNRIHAQTEHV